MLDLTKINKTIREIRRENRYEDKILRDLDFTFYPEKHHYEPKMFMLFIITIFSMRVLEKNLSIKEYIDIIRPYLSDVINNHKTQGEWKIRSSNIITDHKTQEEWIILLTMATDFISSEDSDEACTMHTKNDNIEIMMSSERDEIIKYFFELLLQRYQEGLEESMEESKFIFDSADVLYYNLNKINSNRGGLYIDYPKRLK